jgi:hypothetical protein
MPTPSEAELDPELLKALGAVVVRHAALEEALRDALWLQAETDKVVVHVLFSGLTFRTLVEKFGAVYYEHHPTAREEIERLCGHLLSLNDRRNTFIHSFWSSQVGSAYMMRMKSSVNPKKGLSQRAESVSPATVLELANELGEAEDKVWEVILRLMPPSS